MAAGTSSFVEFDGKPLVGAIDALFTRAAFDELEHDHRWAIWRAATRPARGSAIPRRIDGILLTTPPPTHGLLLRLLGPGWWASLDGVLHDIERVQPESDPLLRAAGNMRAGPLRGTFVAAVIEARPKVLFAAAEPVFGAIDDGALALTGLDGFDRRRVPRDVFAGRRWRLRRDGGLIVPNASGGHLTLLDVRMEVARPSDPPAPAKHAHRRGYGDADEPLLAKMKQIVDQQQVSIFQAAGMVSPSAKGSKHSQTTQKRLSARFYDRYPEYRVQRTAPNCSD